MDKPKIGDLILPTTEKKYRDSMKETFDLGVDLGEKTLKAELTTANEIIKAIKETCIHNEDDKYYIVPDKLLKGK